MPQSVATGLAGSSIDVLATFGNLGSRRYKSEMSEPQLRREVPRRRRRPNAFWYKATAISFTVKLVLLVVIFLAVRASFN
jgi:hypothetical protein